MKVDGPLVGWRMIGTRSVHCLYVGHGRCSNGRPNGVVRGEEEGGGERRGGGRGMGRV